MRLPRLEVIDVELSDDWKPLDFVSGEGGRGQGREGPDHDRQGRRQTDRGSAVAALGRCIAAHHPLSE